MKIPHLSRPDDSSFYPLVKTALVGSPCSPVCCDLRKPGGYNGNVLVDIADGDEFETDWSRPDPTRFPARIRAAATALRDIGFVGKFRVTHQDGSLTISRV
jgi:hypothetical protein